MNQSSKLLLAVLGTVCAAWLAARVTHPALPVSRQVQAVSSPASWSEGVSYAETISRPEQSPRMSALDLPRGDAEFKLPWAPTRAWAQHRLCQADGERQGCCRVVQWIATLRVGAVRRRTGPRWTAGAGDQFRV